MAPEVHGAQVLPDLDYKSKNVIHPHLNTGTIKLLFDKAFTKSNG